MGGNKGQGRGMGQGRGQGRGRGRGHHRRGFFLQSCLLVMLMREPNYGYNLMEGLGKFGFKPDQMDISSIYRALRDLEATELVSDSWDDKSLGPKRRVYAITLTGEKMLEGWMDNLRRRLKEIQALEKAYETVKKKK